MIRGTTVFICDNCGMTFRGLNIEYGATVLSTPQKCPKCGSYHTMPKGNIFTSSYKDIYEEIWTELDHNHNNKIEFWTVQLEESQKEDEGCHSYESVEENTIPPKPFFLDQCEGTLMIAFALPLLFLSSVKDWLKEQFSHTKNKI